MVEHRSPKPRVVGSSPSTPASPAAAGEGAGTAPEHSAGPGQKPSRREDDSGPVDRFFTRVATWISTAAGQPLSFMLALGIIIIWGVTGPVFGFSDTWQLIINTGTTIVTFLMVFLIQNSQNRDGAAMQAKLDELLRAVQKARSQFIGIEHLTDRQIETIRAALEREAKRTDAEHGKQDTADDTVDRLLDRY